MKKIDSLDDAVNDPRIWAVLAIVVFFFIFFPSTSTLVEPSESGRMSYGLSLGGLEFLKSLGLGVLGFVTGIVAANFVISGRLPGFGMFVSRFGRRRRN